MPRLKTESEVATIHYLRHKAKIPVSTIYHHDSNPYNRLGGEFILMSKVCIFEASLCQEYINHVIYRHPAFRFPRFIMSSLMMILSS